MNDTTMMSGQKVKRSKVKEIIVVYGSSEHSDSVYFYTHPKCTCTLNLKVRL